jgi:uncharacterized membrane protein YfcA
VSIWVIFGVGVVGFLAGVLSGMFGVGGAVLTTPGIRAFGASPIASIGSTVPAILPGSITGAIRYAREGLVDWRVGLVCGGAGSVLAVGGAKVADVVDPHLLLVLTAAILLWSGIQTIRAGRHEPSAPDRELLAGEADEAAPGHAGGRDPVVAPSASSVAPGVDAQTGLATDLATDLDGEPGDGHRPLSMLLLVGAGAGFLAGLLGVGGGVVMVPVFINILRMPLKRAVGSSLVSVALFSIPALVTHAVLGHIDWAYALPLVAGVIPGAQVGSKIAIGAADRTVRLLFGSFLVVLAIGYGASELRSLLA